MNLIELYFIKEGKRIEFVEAAKRLLLVSSDVHHCSYSYSDRTIPYVGGSTTTNSTSYNGTRTVHVKI